MTKDIKNLPASAHDRLNRIAKENGQTFQDVFYRFAWERFLFRLSMSKYSKDFSLKGALMFLGWGLPLRRPTRDIDLQGYTTNSVANLEDIIREVCDQTVEPDGMIYLSRTVVGDEIMNEMLYPGVRLRLQGLLGRSKIWLQVDVSFGNVVTPSDIKVNYPTLLEELGMSPFPINGYPFETSIAEKFHAIVKLEILNDRIRDFYDIWLISHHFNIQGHVLAEAITATFRSRETQIPDEIPVGLTETFVKEKNLDWARFLKKLPLTSEAPVQFEQLISQLQKLLVPPMLAAAKQEEFERIWRNKKGWVKI